MEFVPKLIRRQQEELIIDQVALPSEWLKEHREAFKWRSEEGSSAEKGWTERDLISIFSAQRLYVVTPDNALVLGLRNNF